MTERYCLVEPYDPAALAMKSQRLYTSRLFAYRDEQQRERDMQRERAAMGVAMGLGAAGGQDSEEQAGGEEGMEGPTSIEVGGPVQFGELS